MSLGTAAGKMDEKTMMPVLWKFVILEGVVSTIILATGSWFYWGIVAFVLTYLGALAAGM